MTCRRQQRPALAESVIPRWFTPEFGERQPQTVDRFRSMLAACPVDGYAGCCAAVRDADLREDIGRIGAATLVIGGTHEVATPAGAADFIRERVAGARVVVLDAAHLSNVEQPEAGAAGYAYGLLAAGSDLRRPARPSFAVYYPGRAPRACAGSILV